MQSLSVAMYALPLLPFRSQAGARQVSQAAGAWHRTAVGDAGTTRPRGSGSKNNPSHRLPKADSGLIERDDLVRLAHAAHAVIALGARSLAAIMSMIWSRVSRTANERSALQPLAGFPLT